MDEFLRGYVDCALWLLKDEEGNPLDKEYTPNDCATLDKMAFDCEDFKRVAGTLLDTLDPGRAGFLFFLNRNHHGSGFWDEGLGPVGTALSDLSHKAGGTNEYACEGKWYSE